MHFSCFTWILSVCLTENHAKSKKNVTKLISVRKKSYTFSKYLMPSILKYIIHISYIHMYFHFVVK